MSGLLNDGKYLILYFDFVIVKYNIILYFYIKYVKQKYNERHKILLMLSSLRTTYLLIPL